MEEVNTDLVKANEFYSQGFNFAERKFQQRIEELEQAGLYLYSFVPVWAKEVTLGLDPTMYGTGSSAGDMEVAKYIFNIRKLLGILEKEEDA